MTVNDMYLGFQERVVFTLRELYARYGYRRYKMGKFEEYDLYARNKDFLISDSVITFTDTNGKLMALKPDVTLSIVKNSRDELGSVQKLFYNENVYRVSKGSHSFKEITQLGLECLGEIDDYCLCEVLSLAAKSLLSISKDSILELSHLGILSDIVDAMAIPEESRAELLRCIGEKNIHELTALCRASGVSEENTELFRRIIGTNGEPDAALSAIGELLRGVAELDAVDTLLGIVNAMEPRLKSILRFDFSVVDDINYYNGLVFKGFIHGLPSSVLSGGQYDKLMRKMGRRSGAVGFAVYMDALDLLDMGRRDYDTDVVLLYDEASISEIQAQVKYLTERGSSVMVQRSLPENIRYRQLMKLSRGEVEVLEDNA